MDFRLNDYLMEMNNLEDHAIEMTTWEDLEVFFCINPGILNN